MIDSLKDRYQEVLVGVGVGVEHHKGRRKGRLLEARMMLRMTLDCLHQVTQRMTKWLAEEGNSLWTKACGPYSGMGLVIGQQN